MLREQVAELFFSGRYEAATKRLQKLIKHGYIRERRAEARRGQYLPRWLVLAEAGFIALKEDARIEPRFTWEGARKRLDVAASTLLHELDVVDLWVAFAKAIRGIPNFSLRRFSTWPELYQFRRTGSGARSASPLYADAFASIAYADDPALPPIESPIFFEWDRSTEWRSVLREKAVGYDHFFRSGAFAERQGATRSDAEDYPFRVVFALKNDERRNNLLEELARPGGGARLIPDQFWCTTWEEIRSDPLGPVYLHIGDYTAATRGTMYDPAKYTTTKRVIERDDLVERKAAKRKLFA
jgi:hypothetical protein